LATDLLGRADKVGDPHGDPIRIDVGHVHSVDDLTVTQLLLLLRERIAVLQGELKLSGRELEFAGVLSNGASPYLRSRHDSRS
jgi:hypothetical protein